MATKVKIDRKEIKGPDKFAQFIEKSSKYLVDHYHFIIYVILGITAVIIISFLIINYNNKKLSDANTYYNQAIIYNNNGQPEKAIEQFKLLQKNHSGQAISKLSYYYLSSIYYNMGNYDQSIKSANEFLNQGINDINLIDAANLTLAMSYFSKNEWQKAHEYSIKIQNSYSPYINDASMIKGLSLEKLGKHEEASEIYKEILNKTYPSQFPNPL